MKKLLLGVMLFAGVGLGFARESKEVSYVEKAKVEAENVNLINKKVETFDSIESVKGICLGSMLITEKVITEEQGMDGNTYEVTTTYYHFVTYYYTCNK